MTPQETAIVWIDVDNEFLEEGGKLHGAVKEVLDEFPVVSNMNRLNKKAREAGAQVIFIPILVSEDYREMGEDPQGILGVVKEAGALKRGTWGTQVADGLEVEEGDLVLGEKTSMCAFETTRLDEELRRRGIREIAIGGLLTNACVESTMRTAYDKGYTVHSLTDCSATLSLESHAAAVQHSWPLFSSPITTAELLEKLSS